MSTIPTYIKQASTYPRRYVTTKVLRAQTLANRPWAHHTNIATQKPQKKIARVKPYLHYQTCPIRPLTSHSARDRPQDLVTIHLQANHVAYDRTRKDLKYPDLTKCNNVGGNV